MPTRVVAVWEAIVSSYWFVPSLMALGAILLSFVTSTIDQQYSDAWADAQWFSVNTADGARALLSTIAGAMITVAGVTFSITIAALAYVTSQLGPHLLRNFMRDVSNQITLGTFISTYIYCLLILRTVEGEGGGYFVPHLGIVFAIGLTLASVSVLIYFFHHVPKSIQASQVIAQIGGELQRRIKNIDKRNDNVLETDEKEFADNLERNLKVFSHGSGYVNFIDTDQLVKLASINDLLLKIECHPGDFVHSQKTLATGRGEATEAILNKIADAFTLGRERTHTQDILFNVQQLVQIAARALSPGVNDPFTANDCLDWLSAGLVLLGYQPTSSKIMHAHDNSPRVIGQSIGFERMAAAIFDPLRPYVCQDKNAALHMLNVLEDLNKTFANTECRQILLEHAIKLKDAVEENGKIDFNGHLEETFQNIVNNMNAENAHRGN